MQGLLNRMLVTSGGIPLGITMVTMVTMVLPHDVQQLCLPSKRMRVDLRRVVILYPGGSIRRANQRGISEGGSIYQEYLFLILHSSYCTLWLGYLVSQHS